MQHTNWHILVVEDEYDSIQVVSKILRHHGAQVSVVRNGQECLNVINDLDPSLIIMDLALPEMDGWETLDALRANSKTRAIPVIAVTAYHSVNVAEDARKAGFDAYFPKPIDPNSIIQLLLQFIEP